MSAGLEKTEQQLEKAKVDLVSIRERKADIIEKEKAAIARIEELDNQCILQIVEVYKLNGTELKEKLAAIMSANALKSTNERIIDDEEIE